MTEWSNVPVSKTGVPQGTGGSNPPLSAFSYLLWQPYDTLPYPVPNGVYDTSHPPAWAKWSNKPIVASSRIWSVLGCAIGVSIGVFRSQPFARSPCPELVPDRFNGGMGFKGRRRLYSIDCRKAPQPSLLAGGIGLDEPLCFSTSGQPVCGWNISF